ncbi:hypothetical protein CWC22_011085 [Pseudoalteromonas rubra]|uniref:Lipoprotein n=1 Tax=Pseudoalteromonas rubra TaxID=43658 RepID=A0A7S7YTS3_9GAMM|nr:hypothetical protein [Pseudoalteromonas rubra]QPB83502.1 hypothetical protein CWC22_011085 [Pseudoalteromonas rubra]
MKQIFTLLLIFSLVGCNDSNKDVVKAGVKKDCQYDIQEGFQVTLHSTEIPNEDPKLIKFEMSSVILSETDYQNALSEIQDNCCFQEREHPTNEQFRIFVNEKPNVAKASCMFDVLNKGIVYIHKQWSDV